MLCRKPCLFSACQTRVHSTARVALLASLIVRRLRGIVTNRIMFYCQHVLGIGHLVRSAEIVRELGRDSRVLLVPGGEIPHGFRFPEKIGTLQLIPLKTSPDSSTLQLSYFSRGLQETSARRRTFWI